MMAYPACAMLENARSRFKLLCISADIFPTVIVKTATSQIAKSQFVSNAGNASINVLNSTANAAAFIPTDMNPVTVTGAP